MEGSSSAAISSPVPCQHLCLICMACNGRQQSSSASSPLRLLHLLQNCTQARRCLCKPLACQIPHCLFSPKAPKACLSAEDLTTVRQKDGDPACQLGQGKDQAKHHLSRVQDSLPALAALNKGNPLQTPLSLRIDTAVPTFPSQHLDSAARLRGGFLG